MLSSHVCRRMRRSRPPPATAGGAASRSAGRNTSPGAARTAATAAGAATSCWSATHDTNNLVDFKFKSHWKAGRGEHGLGKDCNGKEGRDAVLRLPLGTVVTDDATGRVVAELVEDGQRVVLCKGGNGGWGNTHFKTSTNRAPEPRQSRAGGRKRGVSPRPEERSPTSGSSDSPTRASRPSRTPSRMRPSEDGGVSVHDPASPDRSDREPGRDSAATGACSSPTSPGSSRGPARTEGLGHRFLSHIERCALLLIIVDMAGTDGRDPREDYRHLLNELKLYDPAAPEEAEAGRRQQDGPAGGPANLAKFKRRYKVDVLEISCLEGTGLERLKERAAEAGHCLSVERKRMSQAAAA
jgi:GTPase